MKCLWIVCLGLILSTVSATPRTRIPRQVIDEEIDPDYSDINTSPPDYEVETSADDAIPSVKSENGEILCDCPEDKNTSVCVCVPFYLCDANRSILENGEGIIDIRMAKNVPCHYMHVCCSTGEVLDKPIDPKYPKPSPTTIEPWHPDHSTTTPSSEPSPTPIEPWHPDHSTTTPSSESSPTPIEPWHPDHSTTTPSSESSPTTTADTTPTMIPEVCGIRNRIGVSTLRITGAESGEAQFGEFPWMMAVIKQEVVNKTYTKYLYQCGGSLISPNVVLTAAHCVKGKTGLMVRAGEWDTQVPFEPLPIQDRAVRHIVIHEEYYGLFYYNDVALLFLQSPMDTRSPNVGTICLPEQNENMDNRNCTATGWGADLFGKEGQYQVILKSIDLPTVPRDECQQALHETRLGSMFRLHSSFLCAGGEKGRDTCRGDGGGPLVCPSSTDPNVYVQAGIVSWGVGCGTKTPGVYVDVAKFRDWIDTQISKFAFDPRSDFGVLDASGLNKVV